MKKNISILIPAYNEDEVISLLYKRLSALGDKLKSQYAVEFFFVNDGSKDNTLEKIKSLSEIDNRVSYLNLSRNFGKEIAMIAGFDHLKEADAVVIIDADLQDPPELIPDMIQYWEQGYDDVYARRSSRAGESWFKKRTSEWFYGLLQKSTRINIQKDTGDFRLLSKRCVNSISLLRESQRYTKGMFSWIGYKKKEILYDRDPRIAGKTKWNYWRLMDLAIEGITSFTTFPLRLASLLGMTISFAAFIYIIIIVTKTVVYGSDLAGYPSLMAVILFLGGVQLLSLGVIGEYIGRIFNETKNRPLYIVDEIHRGRD
jgi:glycosyltransferase involved in cell wall biosynthesis